MQLTYSVYVANVTFFLFSILSALLHTQIFLIINYMKQKDKIKYEWMKSSKKKKKTFFSLRIKKNHWMQLLELKKTCKQWQWLWLKAGNIMYCPRLFHTASLIHSLIFEWSGKMQQISLKAHQPKAMNSVFYLSAVFIQIFFS